MSYLQSFPSHVMRPHVSMPMEAFRAAPTVSWKHVDGPLLAWAGHLHWLTWGERAQLALRLTTIEAIAQKHWPQRAQFALAQPQ